MRQQHSPRNRLAILTLLGFFLLAQSALFAHSVEHSAAPGSTTCVLCAASHMVGSGASLPDLTPLQLTIDLPQAAEPVVVRLQPVTYYASRAPPLIHA